MAQTGPDNGMDVRGYQDWDQIQDPENSPPPEIGPIDEEGEGNADEQT